MLSPKKLINLNKKLSQYLVDLKLGLIPAIEYGTPKTPESRYFSYIIIRYINTLGGKQFCLKLLNSIGQESSGFYSHDIAEISVIATQQIMHYHRPTNLKFQFQKKMEDSDYDWFVQDNPNYQHQEGKLEIELC